MYLTVHAWKVVPSVPSGQARLRSNSDCPTAMPATTYYDHNRDTLLATYNALDPTEVHAAWSPAHLPFEPGFACDIGAGSGRCASFPSCSVHPACW